VRSEGFYVNEKNPLTPAGIVPAAFRFVAQHLNHCATAVPTQCVQLYQYCTEIKEDKKDVGASKTSINFSKINSVMYQKIAVVGHRNEK